MFNRSYNENWRISLDGTTFATNSNLTYATFRQELESFYKAALTKTENNNGRNGKQKVSSPPLFPNKNSIETNVSFKLKAVLEFVP